MSNTDYDYLEIETYNTDQSNPDKMSLQMLKAIFEKKPQIFGVINKGLQEKSKKFFGEDQDKEQKLEITMEEEEKISEIADLKCPITQCAMEQPVVANCGHSYDFESISDWIKQGRTDCPNCKKNIKLEDMKPNFFAISLIKKILDNN